MMCPPRNLIVAVILCASGASLALADDAAGRQLPPSAAAVVNAPQQQQLPPDLVQQSGNSLLRAGAVMAPPVPVDSSQSPGQSRLASVSLLAVPAPAPRMLKKHDLIQIIIRESTQASSKGNTDAKKDTSLDAHIDSYIKLNNQFQAKGILPTNPLAFTAGTSNEFKGDATAEREDSYVTRIGAEVVDVKPNGTLVIQARKHIKLDEEEQDYILSGVCRVDDIAADNTVLSTQLHDMDLTETTKGVVHDTNDRGFLTKLLATLNPF